MPSFCNDVIATNFEQIMWMSYINQNIFHIWQKFT